MDIESAGEKNSVQVMIDMPFDIRSIECPSHKIWKKVC